MSVQNLFILQQRLVRSIWLWQRHQTEQTLTNLCGDFPGQTRYCSCRGRRASGAGQQMTTTIYHHRAFSRILTLRVTDSQLCITESQIKKC